MRAFYQKLPTIKSSLRQLLSDDSHFSALPHSWHVVITDIKNSTGAIKNGRHQDINLMATASIVAALNVANRDGIDIPFFFGGDGATLLVPDIILEDVLLNLKRHTENAKDQFDLDLRLGSMSMSDLSAQGCTVKLAKINITNYLTIPVVLGDGLAIAERKVKMGPENSIRIKDKDKPLDLSGMECRWDRIKPPDSGNKVLSLLIDSVSPDNQAVIFEQVLKVIEKHYGSIGSRNPITTEKLKIQASYGKIKTEMQARLGRYSLKYMTKHWSTTILGKAYFSSKKNNDPYLKNVALLSDTLVIDGRINTVIAGTVNQRERLISELDAMEANDKIRYGWHESDESIMSCYVRNRIDQHIHFVDGSEGGYSKAAEILKAKIR